jgi:predicted RNase H-like HicB family nuclease
MPQRFYPAVLERGSKLTFAVWFPDFPGCVAAARTQEDAVAKAQEAISQAVVELYEKGKTLPEPTSFEKVALPKECDLIAMIAIGVDPPAPSERVNIYLPKSLIERVDRRATELGMSRSSFFGYAVSSVLLEPLTGQRSIRVSEEALSNLMMAYRQRRKPVKA